MKPLGSEKLTGDDKLKRILDLTYYGQKKTPINESKKSKNGNVEYIAECKTGGVYGIVKEKDGYYVKKGLTENTLDYIGGMFMKNKNKFTSYAESFKRLDLIKGQEELSEATKYVLKSNKPTAPEADEVPAPPMPTDVGGEEELPIPDDMGGEEGMEDETDSKEGGEGKRSDYMQEIQKFSGKLGQELRDQRERLESDDIKYVLNMIISAINLDILDENDLEDIASKFERDEYDDSESDDESTEMDDMGGEEEDLSEIDGMEGLEEFFNSDFEDEEEMDELDVSKYEDLIEMDDEEFDIHEVDMESIKNEINQILGKYIKK